jgi:hypothetical protein
MSVQSYAEFGSKDWANEQLRFAIKVLKGHCGGSNWQSNLATALFVRDRLWAMGWRWQADRVDNWIHRLQLRGADSLKEGERDS